ncbi:methyltransferase family protein [Bogoriella caseilytica]|nr:isoprenylcysteine carboxylmethyltransferase family protein [Bogoriella caseilytica]
MAIRIPPVVLLSTSAAVQHVLARRTDAGKLGLAAGIAVAGASVALLGSSLVAFRRQETSIDPITVTKASALVTDGPHAYSRNPMYVGMAGLLAAHALMRGSWAAAFPVAGYVLAIDRMQIPAEEAALEEGFGEEFADYRARVPRWFGPA